MSRARLYRPTYEVEGPYVTPRAPLWVRLAIALYWAVSLSFIFGALGRYYGVFDGT